MTKKPSLCLVGAGSMGGALLNAWLDLGSIDLSGSVVFDPKIDKALGAKAEKAGLRINPPIDEIAGQTAIDLVIFAVKPQVAGDVLPAYGKITADAVAVSVMAGKSIASIRTSLQTAPRIARAMPNLPASIGKGATGVFAEENVRADERQVIDRVLAAAGDVIWVDTEKAIDFVTAISGSGPAYFFLLTEALAQAGVDLGLTKSVAQDLARATCIGSGALLEKDPRDAGEMRKAVTSPGGTTEAALEIFDGDQKALREIVKKAVRAASDRAGELTA